MSAVNLAVAKAQFSELINKVEAGEEGVITRYGRPVARMIPATPVIQPVQPMPLVRLAALRKNLPPRKGCSAIELRKLRAI